MSGNPVFLRSILFAALLLCLPPLSLLARDNPYLLYPAGQLVRLPLPQDAQGQWTLYKGTQETDRQGRLRPNEKALYFGDLSPGIYYVVWQGEGSETSRSLGFLLLPPEGKDPEDHFFAANQPGLAETARQDSSAFIFTLEAMEKLFLHRLRLNMAPRFQRTQDDQGATTVTYSWGLYDQIQQTTRERNIRLIAVLGETEPRNTGPEVGDLLLLPEANRPRLPQHPRNERGSVQRGLTADYVRQMLRHYGFQLDEFALWPEPNRQFSAPRRWLDRLEPVGAMLQKRSPYSAVALGGLALAEGGQRFYQADLWMPVLLEGGNPWYNVIDFPMKESWEEGRSLEKRLTAWLHGREAGKKAWALCHLAPTGKAGLNRREAQWTQARETAKWLAWCKFQNYRYVAAAALWEEAPEGQALFLRREKDLFEPRAVAGVWRQSHVVLGHKKGIRFFENAAYVLLKLEGRKETTLVGWTRPGQDRPLLVELQSREGLQVRAEDMMGADVTAGKMKALPDNRLEALFSEDPLYVRISGVGEGIGW